MAARSAGIAVTVIVKAFHFSPGAVFALHLAQPLIAFLFCETHGCLNIEPGSRQQIARQNFLRHVIDDGFAHKPCPPLNPRPFPEILMQQDLPCRLKIGCAQSVDKRVCFRYNIKG